MKILRLLLRLLVGLVAVLVVAAMLLLTPPLQGWLVRRHLAQQYPGAKVEFGMLWAGFGRLEVEGLQVERDGALLDVPELSVRLPVLKALLLRDVNVRALTAKGWTLDLTHTAAPAAAAGGVATPTGAVSSTEPQKGMAAESTPAAKRMAEIHRVLAQPQFPFPLTMDGVELEGVVLDRNAAGDAPWRYEVTLNGGGLKTGGEGTFDFVVQHVRLATGNHPVEIKTTGRGTLRMPAPGRVDRAVVKAEMAAVSERWPRGLRSALTATVERQATQERYTLEIGKAERTLLTLDVTYDPARPGLRGIWQAAAQSGDFVEYPLGAWAVLGFAGAGEISTDAALADVTASGRVRVTQPGAQASAVADGFRAAALEGEFAVTRRGATLFCERLQATLAAPGPVADVHLLQPFGWNVRTGALALTDPATPWVRATLRDVPLAWLPVRFGDVRLEGGTMRGEYLVRVQEAGFVFEPVGRLVASGVKLVGPSLAVSDLVVSAGLGGDWSQGRANWRCEPLVVSREEQTLISAELRGVNSPREVKPLAATPVSRGRKAETRPSPEPTWATSFKGTWKADLRAFAGLTEATKPNLAGARSAAGELSVVTDAAVKAEGSITLEGMNPADRLTTTFQGEFGPGPGVHLTAPLTLQWGGKHSEFSADLTWGRSQYGNAIAVRVSGKEAEFEHLRALFERVRVFASKAKVPPLGGKPVPLPAWGDWYGNVALGVGRFRVGAQEFKDVEATLMLDDDALRLTYGRYQFAPESVATVEGEIAFEPAAALPYRLKAKIGPNPYDTKLIFGEPTERHRPLFEGKFEVTRTFQGRAARVPDLMGATEEELRLTSKSGIVRLLKANVAEAEPEKAQPVMEGVGRFGSAVGSIFGMGRSSRPGAGMARVEPRLQAVLDFTYPLAELGYSDLTITAKRGADPMIRVTELTMNAGKVRARGVGQLTPLAGQPLGKAPVALSLKLGVNGQLAELMTKAGLAGGNKDADGYLWLAEDVKLGGTLENMDRSAWERLLRSRTLNAER